MHWDKCTQTTSRSVLYFLSGYTYGKNIYNILNSCTVFLSICHYNGNPQNLYPLIKFWPDQNHNHHCSTFSKNCNFLPLTHKTKKCVLYSTTIIVVSTLSLHACTKTEEVLQNLFLKPDEMNWADLGRWQLYVIFTSNTGLNVNNVLLP